MATGNASPSPLPTGWKLLHAKLPSAAIKELATDVYGVAGLSDVNEGYLIQRLFASEMPWEWRIRKQQYLGFEDKTTRGTKDKPGYPYRVYMAAVHGRLQILDTHGWRVFDGSGASDNRKLDAAYKGAATVAFKNACKLAGLTAELYLDGRAIDHIYSERVRKDPEMIPETVKGLVEKITEVYGDPAEQAQQSERLGIEPNVASATAPIPAMTSAVSVQAKKAQEGTQGAAPRNPGDAEPKTNDSAPPASSDPDEDRQALYVLARTLATPRTVLEVDGKIAKQSLSAVRRELILAHARDHGPACIHVAELAGLSVAK